MTRRGRRRRAGQQGLPDWAWGLGLGALAVIIVGGFFMVTEVIGGGGGSSTCDQQLEPLGVSDISQEAFQEEYDALTRVINLLNQGDRAGAESAFFGPTHNFTHNVDPPVRQQDEELAKQICESVLDVEDALTTREPNATLVAMLTELRDLIAEAATVLGYDRPA